MQKDLNLCARMTANMRLTFHFLAEKYRLQQYFCESLDRLIKSQNLRVPFHLINAKSSILSAKEVAIFHEIINYLR